ncbi:hypothetical protein MJO29_011163 [Puccinia striiformis f. sp. tritici]|uniref:Thiamine-binding protein domain-containing protein n=1 Tax=Puccinia striiformis f. sp. tritici PST-78 TaxID=1165861 RepID=A0A0L0UT29_9BASI|nr:hypothetical protein Pst134EA_021056 [Puccinia striiformis f. sp. tritici]KAH9447855.1 hypothetical protein Pst134EB_021849 [Puccinia striiformis f. sp. tritici]KAH9457166.1 hypothetical protein Pst134EA_021056 [Puccinia striiformis f. sp. tritici]KAI7946636.1 hypothetical protein MJO29_011163 [Puccinia striiformis f. sp. tritici]KNE90203.1 hypothetical protein PSTG_16346 [Puccinia striiformis f. sp. tritici PST-78]
MTNADERSTSLNHCTADFCLIPIGGEDGASVGKYIAECQRVLAKTGLEYKMHGYGTGLEGPWDEVMNAIKACHEAVHKMGCPRVATDIRIGTRIDKPSSLSQKVQSVEERLASNSFAE